MKARPNKSTSGFTLIELLVAMAITTIIITILVSVTAMSLDTWNRSRSEVRAARQGKAMVDTMARDLESLVTRKGNNFEWLYAKSNPSSDGPKGNSSPNAIDLIFFSAATDRYNGQIGKPEDLGGDVSTIGYQLVYKDPIDSSATDDFKTFVLYRKLVDPKETFEKNLGQTTLDGKVDFGSSGTTAVSAKENFICENVYQFTITLHLNYTEGTTAKTARVSIGQGANSAKNLSIKGTGITDNSGAEITGIAGITGAQIKSSQLTAVEVSLTVLTDFGLQQLRRRSFTPDAKATFISQNSYEYSKVVQVPGS